MSPAKSAHRPGPMASGDGPGWRLRALCRLASPKVTEWFFDRRYWEDAKRWCTQCPVRTDCLADAMASGDRWAVAGGLDPDERAKLRGEVYRYPEGRAGE